tara:strand:+ start:3405 stop:4901 length:1497 start_codon:yes stop_codon:yes gene_type:complete
MASSNALFVILGNQLFPEKHLNPYKDSKFFMAEDYGLCTYEKHHQHKIILFLSAMRFYADELKNKGYDLTYKKLDPKISYEEKLEKALKNKTKLISFEIEDKFFERRIKDFCKKHGIEWQQVESPMFMCSRQSFEQYKTEVKKPFLKTFYERQRKINSILLDAKGKPEGGKWSFDADNRKKMPKDVVLPEIKIPKNKNPHIIEVKKLTEQHFSDHPGSTQNFWLPTTRKEYLSLLQMFLKNSLKDFGSYQDAINERSPFLFHSLLSPGINMGLILPEEVIQKVVDHYYKNKKVIPLNSVEGFVRQVLGWREFIRGIYQNYSDQQESTNFWQHKRKMKTSWYTGNLGIPPVDYAIKKALDYGYNHHIERLMVLSNIMLLSEINPKEVHSWFMQMYVDSSDWVMGPNVYGMGQFSDGGIFATKPYICGSNYILKMSDYKKGEWCDVLDGLYWRFIDKHRKFFSQNPRLNMMLRSLDKMKEEKKSRIFAAANAFLQEHTEV